MVVEGPSAGSNPARPRQTLSDCFEAARDRFKSDIAGPLTQKDPKRAPNIELFLNGTKLDDLKQRCEALSMEAGGEKANKAAQLWSTLDQFKGAADVFLEFAPESVSIVWFGISSLITIGNAKVQTRLLICETCDSIANIVADCVRWEARTAQMQTGVDVPKLDIWDSDISDLIFRIFDFLWNAMPHMDQSRAKRLGSTLKELFTKELQQKVDALLDAHKQIVETAKAHFEESVFRETFQTGLRIEKIAEDLRQYLSIGYEVFDALRKQNLLDELDRLRDEFQHSHTQSSRLHFSILTDRINKITSDRGGRLASSWIFKEDAYLDWKSDTNSTTMICLRGPRGHGKSVAMVSVQREVLEFHISKEVLICHFFFKRGEQEMQRTRVALESILYQLLNSRQLRKSLDAVLNVIQILNPAFGERDQDRGASSSSRTPISSIGTLCDTIRLVAIAIPSRVYVMLDALDECLDRREQDFAQHLKSLATATKDTGLRIIISVRDSVDIESEMIGNTATDEPKIPEEMKFVEITAEKNSIDLREYLMHDVGEVLKRQIDQKKYGQFFDHKLSRIVDIVHKKAKGDFTLARMVVANLQQPSKDTFEKRITQLPSAIGEIYMASLESLTPDEQEFVVTALRWTVWAVSSVTVLEISDHYRELYKCSNLESHPAADSRPISEEDIKFDIEDPTYDDPYDRPEIQEIIYHIENAGRDFFRFNKATGIISVDISIREWIQEDTTSGNKSAIKGSRGFNKFRDLQGNTVFNFVLTLHALNSESFQKEHMSWTPLWDGSATRRNRYEISHWHDHIRILQKWWTKDSLNDSWWSDLLSQLSIFMQPENWHLWHLQHRLQLSERDLNPRALFLGLFDSPLHVACELGLSLMVDLVVQEAHENSISHQAKERERNHSLEGNERLKTLFTERAKLFTSALLRMQGFTIETAKWVLPQLSAHELQEQLAPYNGDDWINSPFFSKLSSEQQNIFMGKKVWLQNNIDQAVSKSFNYNLERIWDSYDTTGMLPLPVAARNPKIVRQLIEYGADINKKSLRSDAFLRRGTGGVWMPQPLALILEEATQTLWVEEDYTTLLLLLDSAGSLVSEGACLDFHDDENPAASTPLHMAARIRNLRFFKLLCVSGNWDVHKEDIHGRTPLHCLFDGPPPKNARDAEDSLTICRILINMKTPDKDLIDVEDLHSKTALAYAVGLRFTEAVKLLIELGADIHDLDNIDANCFHHLVGSFLYGFGPSHGSGAEIAIAEILYENGLDITKEDATGNSPLTKALEKENWELSRYFLSKYEEIAVRNDMKLLLRQADIGATLIHYTARAAGDDDRALDFFQHLVKVLGKYTNINNLLLRPDEKGNTATYYAVERAKLGLLQCIVNMNVPLGCKESEQLTALDLSVQLIVEPTEDIIRIQPESDVRIKVFYFTLQNTAPSDFSFSFLGATTFHLHELPGGITPQEKETLQRLDLENLFSILAREHPARDIYGWSLFDALFANDLNGHAPHISQQHPSQTEIYATPIATDMFCSARKFGNRVRSASVDGTNELDKDTVITTLRSKQPVPPLNKTFYFEVEVTLEEW
ncbi:hypothetical protein TWF281_004343 [Arthrobotrys megalospora]